MLVMMTPSTPRNRALLPGALITLALMQPAAGAAPPPGPPPTPAPYAPAARQAPAPLRSAQVESLLDLIPDQAGAALVLRRPSFSLLRTFLDSDPAMRTELGDYLERVLGVDLTRLEGAVVFSTNLSQTPGVGVILRLPGAAALKQKPVDSFLGVSLYDLAPNVRAAIVPQGIALGTDGEVRNAIALGQRRTAGVTARSGLGVLLRDDLRTADLALAVRVDAISDPQLQTQAQRFGVEQVTFTFRDGQLTLSAQGDAAKLGAARDLLRGGLTLGLQEIERRKQEALRGTDHAEAIGAIVAAHTMGRMVEEATPVLTGNELQMRYHLPVLDMTATVPLFGVLAAVAIPSFSKYQKRSTAVEARLRLGLLRTALISYHEQHRGKAFVFPTSVGWTPGVACCGQPDNKCQPGDKVFRHPTWQALHFNIDDPHVYQYRLTSTGKGKTARVVVEARTDSGCKGEYNTLRMEGHLDDAGALQLTDPSEIPDSK